MLSAVALPIPRIQEQNSRTSTSDRRSEAPSALSPGSAGLSVSTVPQMDASQSELHIGKPPTSCDSTQESAVAAAEPTSVTASLLQLRDLLASFGETRSWPHESALVTLAICAAVCSSVEAISAAAGSGVLLAACVATGATSASHGTDDSSKSSVSSAGLLARGLSVRFFSSRSNRSSWR